MGIKFSNPQCGCSSSHSPWSPGAGPLRPSAAPPRECSQSPPQFCQPLGIGAARPAQVGPANHQMTAVTTTGRTAACVIRMCPTEEQPPTQFAELIARAILQVLSPGQFPSFWRSTVGTGKTAVTAYRHTMGKETHQFNVAGNVLLGANGSTWKPNEDDLLALQTTAWHRFWSECPLPI